MHKVLFATLSMIALTLCSEVLSSASPTKKADSFQTLRYEDGLIVNFNPPQDFTFNPSNNTFEQLESFSRITISETKIPYTQFEESLTKAFFNQNNIELVSKEQVQKNGFDATFISLKHQLTNTKFQKFMFVIGDDFSSIQIEASFPETANASFQSLIKQSLLETFLTIDPKQRVYAGLPFLLSSTPGFNLTKRFQNSAVLSPLQQNEHPVIFSHGTIKEDVQDIEQLAQQFLTRLKKAKNVKVVKSEMVKLDKVPALSTVAKVELAGQPEVIYQVLAYQKQRFLLVQSIVDEKSLTEKKADIDRLLYYFKFK